MAPAVQKERSDISLASNPRFGPQKPTAVLRVFNNMVGVMFSHLPVEVMTQASGVERGATWALRCIAHLRRNSLGNKRESLDAFCMIPPPPP